MLSSLFLLEFVRFIDEFSYNITIYNMATVVKHLGPFASVGFGTVRRGGSEPPAGLAASGGASSRAVHEPPLPRRTGALTPHEEADTGHQSNSWTPRRIRQRQGAYGRCTAAAS